jgi:hypothetical protein
MRVIIVPFSGVRTNIILCNRSRIWFSFLNGPAIPYRQFSIHWVCYPITDWFKKLQQNFVFDKMNDKWTNQQRGDSSFSKTHSGIFIRRLEGNGVGYCILREGKVKVAKKLWKFIDGRCLEWRVSSFIK